MPTAKISDAWARNLTWTRALNSHLRGKTGDKPPPKQLTYIDTMDRVLVLSSGGTKAWRVMTYEAGKAVSCKIGTYPAMTVKDARDKARECFEHPDKAEAQAGTFKDVAEKWFRHHVERNELRSAKNLKWHLSTLAKPSICRYRAA